MAGKRQRKKQNKEWKLCPLCGEELPSNTEERVVGKTGRAVCAECLNASQRIFAAAEKRPASLPESGLVSPQEMIRQLDRAIISQTQAKRAVALAMWKQQLRSKGTVLPNTSLLLYGPTGCGKTALVREAARIAGLPFLSFDATTLSETGYRGRNAKDMVVDLVERCGAERAVNGVIFVDEIDKLAAVKGNEYRAAYSRGTQHTLLKLIEGADIHVDGLPFQTENILFLFGGAFSGIQREEMRKGIVGFERESIEVSTKPELSVDDFVDYGMEPELMGRIGRCVPLCELGAAELRQILLESDLSVLHTYKKFFQNRGELLEVSEDEIDSLVAQALKRRTGARGLNTMVEEWMEPKLFQLAEGA